MAAPVLFSHCVWRNLGHRPHARSTMACSASGEHARRRGVLRRRHRSLLLLVAGVLAAAALWLRTRLREGKPNELRVLGGRGLGGFVRPMSTRVR